ASVDPVVMAASTVLRLQTIVSREVGPSDAAVVTVGALQAGTKENVIPDEAVIKLNVRTFDENVRQHVLDAITRIVNAESEASGAPKPPEITPLDRYDLVRNDDQATGRVRDALHAHFGDERVTHTGPAPASEDFGSFGVEWQVPSVFWFIGAIDPATYAKAEREGGLSELPTNHNPKFAPAIDPTLETGVATSAPPDERDRTPTHNRTCSCVCTRCPNSGRRPVWRGKRAGDCDHPAGSSSGPRRRRPPASFAQPGMRSMTAMAKS